MVKINLLPSHVAERRKVKGLFRLLLFVILVQVGLFSFYVANLAKTEKEKQAALTDAKRRADIVRGLEASYQAELTAAGPINSKLAWYDGIYKHNEAFIAPLQKINEYIYSKLTVRRLALSGTAVSLDCATSDLGQVATAYLNLYNCPYIARGSVVMNPISAGGGRGRTAARRPGGGRAGAMPRMGGAGGRRAGRTATGNAAANGSLNPNETFSVAFSYSLLPEHGLGSQGKVAPGAPGASAPTAGSGTRRPGRPPRRGPSRG